MKSIMLSVILIIGISVSLVGSPPEEDVVVEPGVVQNGNITTVNADIIVLNGARVKGQVKSTNGDIYIEENARVKKIKSIYGDVFLDEGVTVDQTIVTTDGSIRIKQNSTIKGNIVTETGDIRVDNSVLKRSVKTRHGSIILKQGTYVKGSITILNRGHGQDLEPLDIYLGQGVYIKGNVTAANENDAVEIQIWGGEVHGRIRRVTTYEAPGEEPDECDGVDAWVSNIVYTQGDLVAYDDHVWRAGWWTRGAEPGSTGQNGVWQDQGPCGATTGCGGRPIWTSTAIFTAGTEISHLNHVYEARWWTRGDDPTAPGYNNPWEDEGPCDDD